MRNTSLAKAELEISRLIARLDLDAVLKRPTTFAKEKRKQHPSWRGIKWSYDEEAKVQSLIFRLSRKKEKHIKKKWLSREEITTFWFERRLYLSKHAEQDSTENSEPKQVTQERESDLQNYFDDKPQ